MLWVNDPSSLQKPGSARPHATKKYGPELTNEA